MMFVLFVGAVALMPGLEAAMSVIPLTRNIKDYTYQPMFPSAEWKKRVARLQAAESSVGVRDEVANGEVKNLDHW
jgi:hypothetical protein